MNSLKQLLVKCLALKSTHIVLAALLWAGLAYSLWLDEQLSKLERLDRQTHEMTRELEDKSRYVQRRNTNEAEALLDSLFTPDNSAFFTSDELAQQAVDSMLTNSQLSYANTEPLTTNYEFYTMVGRTLSFSGSLTDYLSVVEQLSNRFHIQLISLSKDSDEQTYSISFRLDYYVWVDY